MAVRSQAPSGRTGRQRTNRSVYEGGYIHGTAAPKLEPRVEPSPKRRSRPPAQKTKSRRAVRSSHRIRRNQERAMYMDLPYVIMLTIASVFTLYLCVNYLHVQSSITARMHKIEGLESELEKLRAENDALETSINTSVDLNQIYEIATKELGMVYAQKNQVLLYDQTESEYVRQYEDIPEH